MMWIRSAQIRALERPPTSLTDNIIMEMKKETLSQLTFKIQKVLICWLFLTLCLQRLSDLHIHSAVITPPADLSPNMTVSATGSHEFLLCPG